MTRNLIFMALLMLGATNANAQTVQGLARLTMDQFGNPIQSGYPACAYVNQLVIDAAGTMESATWPTGTTDIIFYPADSGNIYGKPNGTGTCSSAEITNGSGCEKNPGHRRVDVTISNSLVITSYGVTADVTGSIVRWCAYNKNKQ